MKMRSVIIFILLLIATAIQAQTKLDTVKTELTNINKIFDSAQYLSFDVDIQYISDSDAIDPVNETMGGHYIMNGKNIYYQLGNYEFMQNDSFAFTVSKAERFMIMDSGALATSSSLFPLRAFVDTVVNYYSAQYAINIKKLDTREIEFLGQSGTTYKRFAVDYDSSSYYPERFEVDFPEHREYPDSDSALIRPKAPATIKLVISFKNFRTDASPEIFSNERFVFFDQQRKKYIPAVAYKNYRFEATGIAGQEVEEEGEEAFSE